MKDLKDIFIKICACRDCGLPYRYRPQLRPPAPQYRPGGVVFLQINPGHIVRVHHADRKSNDDKQKRLLTVRETIMAARGDRRQNIRVHLTSFRCAPRGK